MNAITTVLLIGATLLAVYGAALLVSDQLRRPIRCILGLHAWMPSCSLPHVYYCRWCNARHGGHP